MTADHLSETLAAQRAAFLAELPVPLAARRDRLERLATMLTANADRFAEAMSQDFGHRSRTQSMMTDIVSSVVAMQDALDHLDEWMRPEKRKLPFPLGLLGAGAQIEYQPKGVVGVISPWNFPVYLALAPVAGAIAAGNRVMVKSSELTPATTAALAEAALAYFHPNELSFFGGDHTVGERFASLPFDHLIFTGGTSIGRLVLRAAAEHLVPVTLELGGKSPTLIGRSAALEQAAERITLGKMLNAGQICLAPDYALIPSEREAEFVDAVRTAATKMYPTLLANPDYTSIVNARHRERLGRYLDDARAKGARVIEINPAKENFAAASGNKMPLHLVLGATDDMDVMRHEIFGPILPVKRYERIGEAIDYINAHERPLALYYFGSDEAEKREVLDRTISGGVTLNDVLFHAGIDDLPFGGIGPAGMGAYHGIHGFRTFSHAKSIYRQAWVDINKLGGMKPPYGKGALAMIDRTLKRWRKPGAADAPLFVAKAPR